MVVDVVVPTSSWLIHDFSVSVCDANAYRRYSSWKIRQWSRNLGESLELFGPKSAFWHCIMKLICVPLIACVWVCNNVKWCDYVSHTRFVALSKLLFPISPKQLWHFVYAVFSDGLQRWKNTLCSCKMTSNKGRLHLVWLPAILFTTYISKVSCTLLRKTWRKTTF